MNLTPVINATGKIFKKIAWPVIMALLGENLRRNQPPLPPAAPVQPVGDNRPLIDFERLSERINRLEAQQHDHVEIFTKHQTELITRLAEEGEQLTGALQIVARRVTLVFILLGVSFTLGIVLLILHFTK